MVLFLYLSFALAFGLTVKHKLGPNKSCAALKKNLLFNAAMCLAEATCKHLLWQGQHEIKLNQQDITPRGINRSV